MKKLFLALAFLLSFSASAQTSFRLFDRVVAKGVGITPAKGQIFYTSDANGTIVPLPIGPVGYCLTVSGSLTPAWDSSCGAGGTITFSAPAQFTVTGSGTSSISLGWQNVSSNYALMGPTTGGSTAPSFRGLVPADMPIFAASGTGHTSGSVPDPGATPGISRFLREDSSWSTTGSGTVTSVALALPSEFDISGSPVTSSGTLTAGWNVQTAHYVLIGPNSFGPSPPSFRLLTVDDVPTMTATIKGLVPTPPNDVTKILCGDATWCSPPGGGTVTSVAVTVPSGFSVSGSPITGSGTFGITVDYQYARMFLASPSGSGGLPNFRLMAPDDYPTMTATVKGAVPTPPNDPTQVLTGIGTWGTPPGTGTVTSVAFAPPTGFTISGSPITGFGTLTLGLGTTTAYKLLQTDSGGTVAWSDLLAVGAPAHYISILQPSGTGHGAGLAPDTPGTANTTLFLREDASWALPPQGTVTSVTASVPGEMSFSGGPVTGSGTLNFGWNTEAANYVFAGPVSGTAGVPTFRLLVAGDFPVFIGSGTLHKAGAVPDPGITPGSSKFLREDASWQVPTFSSSIEVKDTSGSPDQTGTSVLRFDASTGLQGTANGSGIYTVTCTTCAGAGATAFKTDTYIGDNTTTIFTLSATPVTNGVAWVALNGLPQQTTAWSLGGSNVTMTMAPHTDALLVIGYYTARPTSTTNFQQDFTAAGSSDFTLTYTPTVDGVIWVSVRGLIQQQTAWSLVGGTTLHMSSAPRSGDIVSINYVH